ncbi:MAG: PEP-utilizing enzyme [Patescibacteria group bacterium]|nr:PEP-utilizing enzyme [Patescibacteria group bacterium]
MNKYLKIIQAAGLVHASSRKLPLFSVSCLFLGYTKLLQEMAGYSYGTIGSIGESNRVNFLINENKVGKLFNRKVKISALAGLNNKFKIRFRKNKLAIVREKRKKDYFKTLEMITKVYPEVLCSIGFYNSIMRYVKDDPERAKKMGKLADSIAKDRDAVANLIYPEIEPLIIKGVDQIGKVLSFDGDLLRYLTLKEFQTFLKAKKLSRIKLAELAKRRSGYVYLFYNNEDMSGSDQRDIAVLRRHFWPDNFKVNLIKGTTAYPGKVRGRVYKSFHGVKSVKPGQILVTNITRPQDTPLLRKFLAIITDEGGILSHVAVIAREFKIPAVMSTKIATKVLRDGDLVEVDADKGVVKIIKS